MLGHKCGKAEGTGVEHLSMSKALVSGPEQPFFLRAASCHKTFRLKNLPDLVSKISPASSPGCPIREAEFILLNSAERLVALFP